MIDIKSIKRVEQFKELESIWNTILQRSSSNNIFSTYEWLCAWWAHFSQGKKLFILLAQKGEEVIGIAPLMIEKKRILRYLPIKTVSFLGTGISDYADFIIVEDREKVLSLFFEYLRVKKSLWDEIDLREIREDSPNLPLIQKELRKLGRISNMHDIGKCPYIKIKSDWNKYYSSLSKNFRQDIRTQYNRIKKNGLKYYFSSRERDIEDISLARLIDLHLDGIVVNNKISFLETEKGRDFFKGIVREFEKRGWITINVMYINNKVAAYALGFQYEKKLYYWNIGKDNKYAFFSPGKLLLQKMLEKYFSENSIEEFDLLRGEEEYKYRWTKLECKNYQFRILSKSLYSRYLSKAQNFYHSIIRR